MTRFSRIRRIVSATALAAMTSLATALVAFAGSGTGPFPT